jgi:hypothetical protein
VRYRITDGCRLPTTDFLGLAELLAAIVLRAAVGEAHLEALASRASAWCVAVVLARSLCPGDRSCSAGSQSP